MVKNILLHFVKKIKKLLSCGSTSSGVISISSFCLYKSASWTLYFSLVHSPAPVIFLYRIKKIIVSNDDDDDNDNKDWTATEKYAIRNSQNFKEGAWLLSTRVRFLGMYIVCRHENGQSSELNG